MKSFKTGVTINALKRALWVLLMVIGISNILANKTLASPTNDSVPSSFDCTVQPHYKYRKDGKPGREIILVFKDSKLFGSAVIKVECNSITEETVGNYPEGVNELSVLLPFGAGVDKECQARISVSTSGNELYRSVIVPAKRQWTVYIYPHSHVDIGYTNTQEFVEKLQAKNIDVAIDLAKKTQSYTKESRFVWNPEASWVVESYLREAGPDKRKQFIEAVRKGWVCLDGSYFNTNTSACSDEELLRLFHYSDWLGGLTGVPVTTMVQFDVAGAAWGITQAAFQNGIDGFLYFPNIGCLRRPWENKPFYWLSPDGKSKILFYQALPYGYGYDIKGEKIGLAKVQGRSDSSIDRIRTTDPTANFLDPLIFRETATLEEQKSPYDIFVMPWSLADNSLIDADLPDAVRLWNEKYAYPKLIIAGSKRILSDFKKRYDSIIPELKGDYTEYWTDGLVSNVTGVGNNRLAVQNLVQMEAAWNMLNYDKPSPRKLIDSTWRYSLLGVEHTWGYQDPTAPLAKQIEQTKASYFDKAIKTSEELLNQAFKPILEPGSNKIAIFNTLSFSRSGLVTLTKEQSEDGNCVLDEKGDTVSCQRLLTGQLAFSAKDIPVMGSKLYTIVKGNTKQFQGCDIKGYTITNNLLSVTIDSLTGNISSLINRENGHEYVNKGSGGQLNSYLYVLGSDSSKTPYYPQNVTVKIEENGPLVASLLIESDAPGCKWLKRRVKVVYNQPWIDITNSFDKIGTLVKESIHFGFAFNVPDGTAHIDVPWGIMIPGFDQMPGANGNWLTFQNWVDISNNHNGVTWTAIESPLLEYGYLAPNLRGWAWYDKQRHWNKTFSKTQTIFSWALNNYWGTNFPLQPSGIVSLHYAIYPHGSYDPVLANRFGLEKNRPLIVIPVAKEPVTKSWVKIDNPKIFISMLKQSDDGKGMILRLRSVSDKGEKVVLDWPNGTPRELYSCLANEKPGHKVENTQVILPLGTLSYYFKM